MDFAFFPAIDLRGGKCVQLVGGVPGTEVVALDDPLAQAERWVEQGSLAEVMVRRLKEGDGEIKPLLSESAVVPEGEPGPSRRRPAE